MTHYAPKKCKYVQLTDIKHSVRNCQCFFKNLKNCLLKLALRDIYLTFRALNKTGDGVLNREEFYRFYEVSSLQWKPVRSLTLQKQWTCFKEFGAMAQNFLNSPYSNHLFSKCVRPNITKFLLFTHINVKSSVDEPASLLDVLILLNSLAMLARWIDGQTSQESWDSYIFSICKQMSLNMSNVQ